MEASEKQEIAVYARDQGITTSNDTVDQLKNGGYTVYGAVADMLERNTEPINKAAEGVGAFVASKKAYQITREYEESRSFFEKWIKNNPLKQQQMEQQRAFTAEAIDVGVQAAIKGGYYAVKKGLKLIDETAVRNSVWMLLYSFGNQLTNQNIGAYSMVHAQMLGYYMQLFHPRKMPDGITPPKEFMAPFSPRNDIQRENMAQLLYQIFHVKHFNGVHEDEFSKDLEQLFGCYLVLGYDINTAQHMLEIFDNLNQSGLSESVRIPQLLQSFYSNLAISMPNIDISRTRRINYELLKYVPNGGRQEIGKFVSKAAITGIATAGGLATGNPIFLRVAAGGAMSMFKDLGKTEIIGNCLKESGITAEEIKLCFDAAKKKQQELPPVL